VSHSDTDEQAAVPGHFRALVLALILTTATLAVQLLHAAGGPAIEQGVVTLRVACTVVWAWFFTAYAVHAIGRRFDAAEEHTAEYFEAIDRRLSALEAAEPQGRTAGLDAEVVDSARVIAHRLMKGGR
jgi:uncharacterized membrane protein YccC